MAWFCKNCGETSSDFAVENTSIAELDLKTGKWTIVRDPCCTDCRSSNITPVIAWNEFMKATV